MRSDIAAGVEQILPAATQELSRNSQDNTETRDFPFTNLSDSDPYACPVELCKQRQPSVWSCNVYKVRPRSGPDATRMPFSQMLSPMLSMRLSWCFLKRMRR